MADVVILCPKCSERLTVPEAADGRMGKCPCGEIFTVDVATMEAPPQAFPTHATRPPEIYGPEEGLLIEPGRSTAEVIHALGGDYVQLEPADGVALLCYYDLGLAFRFNAGALHSIYLYARNPYGFENYLGVIYRGLSTQSTQGDLNIVLGEPQQSRKIPAAAGVAPQLELAYPTMGLTFSVRGNDPMDSSARVRHVIVTRPIRLVTTPPPPQS
jgi:hypothetical protein